MRDDGYNHGVNRINSGGHYGDDNNIASPDNISKLFKDSTGRITASTIVRMEQPDQ